MADKVLLPNTDIEIIEKYPPGRRADFPDFGTVCKTTFAKGVIIEFKRPLMAAGQIKADDPIAVLPLVKVEVDGTQSDFLPIFFHPKEHFWDGEAGVIFDEEEWERIGWAVEAYDATAYDEKTGSFRKAWMSFRVDDEVAVMLKEGVPVAVLAFADGVPRVGEDIVRIEGSKKVWVRMSKAENYAANDKGPDGLDLGLKLEAEAIYDESSEDKPSGSKTLQYDQYADLVEEDTPYEGGLIYCVGIAHAFYYITHATWTTQTLYYKKRVRINLVKIGPILFLIVSVWSGDYSTKDKNESYDGPQAYLATCYTADCIGYPLPIPFSTDSCDGDEGHVRPAVEAWIAAQTTSFGDDGFDLSKYDEQGVSFLVYAAVYSDKLYEDTKANPPTYDFEHNKLIPDPPSGFVLQTGLDDYFGDLHHDQDFHAKANEGVKFFARPHTKAELTAAGLWPGA